MRRVDIRHLKGEFLSTLGQQIKASEPDEVVIFLFEIGDYCEVMNSLKFNQVDWALTIKKGKI